MLSKQKAKELILRIFEEEVLVIGGLAAMSKFDDELLWRLMRNLDAILGKSLAAVTDNDNTHRVQLKRDSMVRPHPAIEEFLAKLKRISGPHDA